MVPPLASSALRVDGVVALHPFLQVIDDRGEAFRARLVVEFLGPGIGEAGEVAGGLDHRHLHAKADAQIGDLLFAGELGGLDLAFGPAFAKAAGDEDGVEVFELGGGVFAFEDLGVDPFGADRVRLAMPPWVSASAMDL